MTGSKKNLKKLSDLTTRVNLVRNLSTTKELPVSTGAKLLGINRTSVYYSGIPVSEEELECKSIIDHLHTDNPTWGARQMSAQLKLRGYQVGRRKAGRYMREMDITPIYPKMNLSKRMKQAKVCPYLLRNAVIDRPNQAWSIDITYLPMKHGFLYLTAIIDWYSRCIVGWDVDDTLDTTMVINACKKAFKVAKPLIINSDQGSQFTSDKYIEFIRDNGIRQSMDGKSRWADNIMIERWFRSFKYEEAYLTEYANLKEAREAIGRYIYTYNFERCHQSIGNKRPAEVYYPVMLLDAARAAA
ncbi:MAG: IS3 family transposase [Oliverpabstia sp.]|nr:IS3 family transposase [Oliverpabstia sp.]